MELHFIRYAVVSIIAAAAADCDWLTAEIVGKQMYVRVTEITGTDVYSMRNASQSNWWEIPVRFMRWKICPLTLPFLHNLFPKDPLDIVVYITVQTHRFCLAFCSMLNMWHSYCSSHTVGFQRYTCVCSFSRIFVVFPVRTTEVFISIRNCYVSAIVASVILP